jgi:hypothetical protein
MRHNYFTANQKYGTSASAVSQSVINIAGYRGQTMRLSFRYTTARLANAQTVIWVDGVSLKTSATTTPNLLVTTPAVSVAGANPDGFSGYAFVPPRASTLSFAASGTANPAAQKLQLRNTVNGTAALNWTLTDDMPWLTTSATSGSIAAGAVSGASATVTPMTEVTASVNTAGLAVGSYSGTITINAAAATGAPVTIAVLLTVSSSTPPVISAARSACSQTSTPACFPSDLSSLAFLSTPGGGTPAPETLSITNKGGGVLNWTATTDKPWLKLSATTGGAGATVTVSVTTTAMGLGTYLGLITITAPGAAKSFVVPVRVFITTTGQEFIPN